jgi:hypothetical protein
MKHTKLFHAAAFAFAAGVAISSTSATAASRCDAPTAPFDQRACAQAAQGPEALRRYVERTRNIYALYYFDYARESTRAVSMVEPIRTAAAPAPSAP